MEITSPPTKGRTEGSSAVSQRARMKKVNDIPPVSTTEPLCMRVSVINCSGCGHLGSVQSMRLDVTALGPVIGDINGGYSWLTSCSMHWYVMSPRLNPFPRERVSHDFSEPKLESLRVEHFSNALREGDEHLASVQGPGRCDNLDQFRANPHRRLRPGVNCSVTPKLRPVNRGVGKPSPHYCQAGTPRRHANSRAHIQDLVLIEEISVRNRVLVKQGIEHTECDALRSRIPARQITLQHLLAAVCGVDHRANRRGIGSFNDDANITAERPRGVESCRRHGDECAGGSSPRRRQRQNVELQFELYVLL
eukprot:570802-Rhodomonas_salina.1